MGGPIAAVLLPKLLTDPDKRSVGHMIELHNQTIGNVTNPLIWDFGFETYASVDDFPMLAEEYGFVPVDQVEISACITNAAGARTLGEFCAILAERFCGIVDFRGALRPDTPIDGSVDISSVDWRVIEPYVTDVLSKLPGRIVAVPYEPSPGRQWVSHYGDSTFMRAWLHHPSFSMIK